jgi:hypothetical protein
MSGCAKGERDRQLVSADGLGAVPVIPAAEVVAQPVIDHLAQLLQGVKDLPGRVASIIDRVDSTGLGWACPARVTARRSHRRWRRS